MESIAPRKVHFAPLKRQQKELARLLREGRYRNVTEFMRAAIDHDLGRLGRPTLSEQARQMADEVDGFHRGALQARSMGTDETW